MAEHVNGAEIKDAQTVDSRAAVHQAAGMLSVQLEVPLAEALTWMQAYAFVHGQFVAEVAAEVVARRLSFDVGDR